MRPTHLTPTELALIDMLATNIETFLKIERTIYGSNVWFTGEEIAAKLDVPERHGMIFNYAFSRLSFDQLEIDGDTIRHRR
jgi:hypothetical protein